ncbi:hypothetical protein [Microcystis phage Mae-JY22]
MPMKQGYQRYEDDGAARVSLTPMGTRVTRFMEPKLQAAANFANADEFVSLVTGCLAFRVIALAVPAGEAVIVGHSTTSGDAAAMKATIDGITTIASGEWDTPDGVPHANVIALVTAAPVSPWIVAADGQRIKSIGLQQTGGTLGLCVLETIE